MTDITILDGEELHNRFGSSQRALAGSTPQAIWLRWWQHRVDRRDELSEEVAAKRDERAALLARTTPLVRRVTAQNLRDGYLIREDADATIRAAERADVP